MRRTAAAASAVKPSASFVDNARAEQQRLRDAATKRRAQADALDTAADALDSTIEVLEQASQHLPAA